jgi:transcriptional regulator with XRE-family HTH domain
VAIRDDIQARRWLVGVELANHRQRSRLTQAGVARELHVSQGLVSQWEQGKYLPEGEQVRRMLDLYGVPEAEVERLLELVARPVELRSWLSRWDGVIAPFVRTFLGCEGFASREFIYAPLVLPALVQTERYAAAMTAPSARVRSDQERRLVELRLARQDRLRDGDLHLTAVIEEDVLDRPAGSREVMHEQLDHLRELADWPNVDLLVIPTAVGRHDGLEGRFTVLYFEAATGSRQAGPIVYVEIPGDAVYKTAHDQVAGYTESADQIVSAALATSGSKDVIEARLVI